MYQFIYEEYGNFNGSLLVMKKNNQIRCISFMLFIFKLLLTRFDLRSSLGEKFFWKNILYELKEKGF